MTDKFYKGKYILALYDMNDNFINLFDNIDQLAKHLKKTKNHIFQMLYATQKGRYVRINKKWITIKLIPIKEEEDE